MPACAGCAGTRLRSPRERRLRGEMISIRGRSRRCSPRQCRTELDCPSHPPSVQAAPCGSHRLDSPSTMRRRHGREGGRRPRWAERQRRRDPAAPLLRVLPLAAQRRGWGATQPWQDPWPGESAALSSPCHTARLEALPNCALPPLCHRFPFQQQQPQQHVQQQMQQRQFQPPPQQIPYPMPRAGGPRKKALICGISYL